MASKKAKRNNRKSTVKKSRSAQPKPKPRVSERKSAPRGMAALIIGLIAPSAAASRLGGGGGEEVPGKEECLNDLSAISAKAQQDYDDFVDAGGSGPELQNLALASIRSSNRVLAASADVLEQSNAALEAITATLETDLKAIKAHIGTLHKAVKAVQLMAELVQMATALAQKFATGGVV